MDEEDKPKSMWQATQEFMFEGPNRDYWLALFRARKLGCLEVQEEPKKPVEIIPPPSKPKVILKPLVCKRCGSTWTPRSETPPTQCPKCRSPYWNREKKR